MCSKNTGKSRRSRSLLILIVLSCLIIASPGASRALSNGDPLPKLTLAEAGTGDLYDVSAYLGGRVGAIVFMQTTCATCRSELSALKRINLGGRDVKVVAVSVDAGPDAMISRYKSVNGFPFLFLRDPTFEKPALFGFSFTPGLVLAGRDGRIALLKRGFEERDVETLEKKIDELGR